MYSNLFKLFAPEHISNNEPLHKHTSFKIGGNADVFLTPDTPELMQQMLHILQLNGYRYFVLGGGNNLIFSDAGFRGVILSTKKLNSIIIKDNVVTAQSGVCLKDLTNLCLDNSLSGLEFACGIPGSVGGAVFMNAGAYGGEMKDVITSVDYLNHDNKLSNHTLGGHNFAYRTSIYQQRNYLVIQAEFTLKEANKEDIQAKMQELTHSRESKQPLEFPSAGSTFRRPEGHFVGKLIDDCGLKGYSIGGAQISQKHSGFIVNKGGATAKDVISLIEFIKDTVFSKYKVTLHTEVRIIPE